MNKGKIPTVKEFADAAKRLTDAGWELVGTVMVDDAHKPEVVNFGRLYTRNGERFYLNLKTIGQLPAA